MTDHDDEPVAPAIYLIKIPCPYADCSYSVTDDAQARQSLTAHLQRKKHGLTYQAAKNKAVLAITEGQRPRYRVMVYRKHEGRDEFLRYEFVMDKPTFVTHWYDETNQEWARYEDA